MLYEVITRHLRRRCRIRGVRIDDMRRRLEGRQDFPGDGAPALLVRPVDFRNDRAEYRRAGRYFHNLDASAMRGGYFLQGGPHRQGNLMALP